MKEANSKTIFQYETKQGNADARSYIAKLRKSKAAIEETRKKAGEDALTYKRNVDSQAKALASDIEEMIEVHQKPLDEIEAKEKARIDNIKQILMQLEGFKVFLHRGVESVQAAMDALDDIEINEALAEFQQKARVIRDAARAHLEDQMLKAQHEAAEKAELERLRKEAADRQKAEEEERLRKEAEERIRIQEEERQRQEKEAQAKREQELRDALKKAEDDKKAVEEKAEKDRLAAIELEEKKRLEAEEKARWLFDNAAEFVKLRGLRVIAEDIERPAAGVRVEVEDADGLDLLQRLECGQGQPVELAEAVAGIAAGMM
jgi:membrane protein involved in colicin uptake